MSKVLLCFLLFFCLFQTTAQDIIKIIEADHHYIQYYGRFDKTDPKKPRFWAPGAYIITRFSGSDCEIFINDQVTEGSHNYIEVKVDNIDPVRIQLRARANRIQIAKDLPGGDHTVTITKNTEASVGFLEMIGFKCNSLLPPPPVPSRKIEFIGDEITTGAGSDTRYMPCDSAEWYDQSNAYSSYGAIAARDLNAQYYLTAVSGLGITKTAGEPGANISQVFNKINLHKNAVEWDFKSYQPDVVTVMLGNNDPINDSSSYINTYLTFLKLLRSKYPIAQIVCVSIPGSAPGDAKSARLRNIIPAVVATAKKSGDQRVQQLILSGTYNKGCNKLPSMEEHLEISSQVTAYLKKLMAW
ncbi:GDSL-type esterase/lipase family protein [Flavitalea sp.]|nr:GDSL-type esterase/lipase family protein [Flavitalea sp.]